MAQYLNTNPIIVESFTISITLNSLGKVKDKIATSNGVKDCNINLLKFFE
jgi:hypothetical protein